MTRSLVLLMILAAAATGCKKDEQAAKPPEAPVQNAMTQKAADMQRTVDKAHAVQQAANAASRHTEEGVADSEGEAAGQ